MDDHTPAADPGPGDAQSEAGDRFPDIAPEGPPNIQSTDWSGGPVPSAGASESSAGPAPDGEPSPTPTPEAQGASDTSPLVAPPADPAAPPPPPVAWAPAVPAAPMVWGTAATQPPGPAPTGGPSAGASPSASAPPGVAPGYGPETAAPPPVGWVVAAPVKREVAPGLVFGSTGRRFVAYLVDWILTLLLIWLVDIAVVLVAPSGSGLGTILSAVSFAGVSLGYLVLGWRSKAHGTPGMRLLKLQIGTAFDGRTLTVDQAFRRWVAMGYPLYLLWLVRPIAGWAVLATIAWWIALIVTTGASQTKQGLHDRVATSAVVEPAGAGSGAIAGVVVILVLVALVLPILSIIALLFLGGQVSQILSTVGSSPAP